MCDFAMLNIMPGNSSEFWREDEAQIVERSEARILETISQAWRAVGDRDCRNKWSGGVLGECEGEMGVGWDGPLRRDFSFAISSSRALLNSA
jgi:hypothetical protein